MSRRFNPDILLANHKKYSWYKCVVADPEFISAIESFKGRVKKEIDKEEFFSYDLKLLKEQGLSNEGADEYLQIIKEFRINEAFLMMFMDGYIPNDVALKAMFALPVKAKEEGDYIVLTMHKSIGAKQFRELWPMVQHVKDTSTTPEIKYAASKANFKLVYSIERALDKGMNFEKIAYLYNQGKLPNYENLDEDPVRTAVELRQYQKDYGFVVRKSAL